MPYASWFLMLNYLRDNPSQRTSSLLDIFEAMLTEDDWCRDTGTYIERHEMERKILEDWRKKLA